jgi:hypothetical protein
MTRPLALSILLALAATAGAQIQVQMSVSRRLFVAYEPIVATVSITNRAGRDLVLRDGPGAQWFGFQVNTSDGMPVPPRNPDYSLEPLTVAAGETVKRSVNLTALYPVTEFGMYRIKAAIYSIDLDRYFTSPSDGIEVSEGKLVWQREVGVPPGQPGAGENRTISLLKFRQPKDNMLYVRVEDPENGVVFCTYPLARLLAMNEPQILLDRENTLHVLQLVGPKTFTYSRVGLNGEYLGTKTYTQTKTRPTMRVGTSGEIEIAGGQVLVPPDQSGGVAPKLSDRPPDMPEE